MMACCNSRVPAAGVYLVLPARIASAAASLMFCGVSKSGSPAPRSTTSTPAARIASAACIAARVDDAFMLATFWETGNFDAIVVAAMGNLKLSSAFHPLLDQWRHEIPD